MNKEIKIRKAREEDLAAILSLLYQLSPPKEKDLLSRNESEKILNKIINDKNYFFIIGEKEGKIAGTAILLIQLNLSHNGRPYGHIENVVTDQNCRGEGIGKKLIDYLIDRAREVGCYKVILDCEKHNIPFYEKCGFQETGEVEMRLNP